MENPIHIDDEGCVVEKSQPTFPALTVGCHPPGGAGYGYHQGDTRCPGTSSTTTIVNQPVQLNINMYPEPLPNTVGSILLSCVVFWCLCPVMGLAAFIVAVIAEGIKEFSDRRLMIRVSYILSVIGINLGVIAITVIIVLTVAVSKETQGVYEEDRPLDQFEDYEYEDADNPS